MGHIRKKLLIVDAPWINLSRYFTIYLWSISILQLRKPHFAFGNEKTTNQINKGKMIIRSSKAHVQVAIDCNE